MRHIHRTWPTLHAQTRDGRAKFWTIQIELEGFDASQPYLVPVYWQGSDGARQTAPRRIYGKNIGKANETSPLQQALLEADAEFRKQRDKGYALPGEDTSARRPLPMLAQEWTKRGHALQFPLLGQPKLDGFRCLYHPDLGFWSRQGKRFDEKVDLSHLRVACGDHILDGELILPPGYTFQQTCESIKKQRPETNLLQFHVFDLVDPERPFLPRYEQLQVLRNGCAAFQKGQVRVVEIMPIHNERQIPDMLAHYLEAGYEGLMLRSAKEGGYEVGHRSVHLQKYKQFDAQEFPVQGVMEGQGREKGCAILTLATPEGLRFNARPRGAYEQRQRLWREREHLVGTHWTVRFQGLSEDGIPRFPVAICEREDA